MKAQSERDCTRLFEADVMANVIHLLEGGADTKMAQRGLKDGDETLRRSMRGKEHWGVKWFKLQMFVYQPEEADGLPGSVFDS
uniref:Uncharacterized protein n=2 Tax=Parascaris TaxID=6254 RepID=A0A915B169_PARUN